jgi:glutamate dehydrogenase
MAQPLTRPELAVLLAYAKIDLDHQLAHSSIPDDPFHAKTLFSYFPPLMRERFAEEIKSHPLRREIIATSLSNDIINRGGSTFAVRLEEETGKGPQDIAHAFTAAMAVYELEALFAAINALDGVIDGEAQLALYRDVQDLLRRQTAWFLRHGSQEGLEPLILRFRTGIEWLSMNLADTLGAESRKRLEAHEARLTREGLTPELAKRLAALAPLTQGLDITRVAVTSGAPMKVVAQSVYALREIFDLDRLTHASEDLPVADYFDRLAVNGCLAGLSAAQRGLAGAIAGAPYQGDIGKWRKANANAVDRISKNLAAILDEQNLTLAKLTVVVSQLRDLAVE